MFGEAEHIGAIEYSERKSDLTETIHRMMLAHPILQQCSPEVRLRQELKLKYIIALCEIGEPPLPTTEELAHENEDRDRIAAIERTERDAWMGSGTLIRSAA